MKILLLADEESKYYWDFFEKDKLEGIDLIISCGDLAPQFLSFLATFAKVPILYIHGNHDGCYDETPPDGCICIDDDIYIHEGIRIMGLGGCMCYNEGNLQFTEKQMKKRARKLERNTGFKTFLELMDKYEPKLFAHGHVHINYGRDFKRESMYGNTRVINAFEKYIIEL